MMICFGTAYTIGAFFQALQQEFAASRGDISLIFSICGFIYFSLGAVSGPLADRYGPRRVIAGGMFLIGLGLALASQAQAVWQVYLSYSLGVGFGVGLAYVPAVGTVQRWFTRRRGLASGIATAGIGVGTLTVPLAATALIQWSDWRGAYLALAAFAVIAGIGSAMLLDHSPQRRGLLPDGDSSAGQPEVSKGPVHISGSTVSQARRARPFQLMYAASFISSFGLFIPFVHLAPYARDNGLPESTGVLLIGLIGIGSTAGRFLVGGFADKLGRRLSLAMMFGAMSLLLILWLFSTSVGTLALFAVLFGMCYGGMVALLPALTTDYFGGRNASSIIGLLYTSVAFGALLGPTLAGVAYDLSRSYTWPILVSATANIAACLCILFTPRLD